MLTFNNRPMGFPDILMKLECRKCSFSWFDPPGYIYVISRLFHCNTKVESFIVPKYPVA